MHAVPALFQFMHYGGKRILPRQRSAGDRHIDEDFTAALRFAETVFHGANAVLSPCVVQLAEAGLTPPRGEKSLHELFHNWRFSRHAGAKFLGRVLIEIWEIFLDKRPQGRVP